MRYYFSKLDKEGREIYKKLYFGMQNFEKKISLKGTENIVREIYYMIIKDNPMMFFVHPSKLTYFKIKTFREKTQNNKYQVGKRKIYP